MMPQVVKDWDCILPTSLFAARYAEISVIYFATVPIVVAVIAFFVRRLIVKHTNR